MAVMLEQCVLHHAAGPINSEDVEAAAIEAAELAVELPEAAELRGRLDGAARVAANVAAALNPSLGAKPTFAHVKALQARGRSLEQ